MKIISLTTGEQAGGIAHAETHHHPDGTDAIAPADIGAAPSSHTHALAEHKATHSTGGSDAIAPADIGAAPSSHTHVLAGHKATHSTGGSDAIVPADIGAAPSSHLHPWGQITGSPFGAPNPYGAISVAGVTATYSGIQFTGCAEPKTIFMVRASDGLSGMWTPAGWKWYFDQNGTLTGGTVPYVRTTGVAKAPEAPQTLALSTGWLANSSAVTPCFQRIDKWVALSGLLRRVTVSGNTIGTLPILYRPTMTSTFITWGYVGDPDENYKPFAVEVASTGVITMKHPNVSTYFSGLSLNGIGFFVS